MPTRLILGSIVICFLAAGCGPPLVKPKGKVLRNGAPLKLGASERLSVFFLPIEVQGNQTDDVHPAICLGGNFECIGSKGKGIPPGKYRISVAIRQRNGGDQLKGEFDEAKSPIVREVTKENAEIVIDLDKPSG